MSENHFNQIQFGLKLGVGQKMMHKILFIQAHYDFTPGGGVSIIIFNYQTINLCIFLFWLMILEFKKGSFFLVAKKQCQNEVCNRQFFFFPF
jgi:hypothetical protein